MGELPLRALLFLFGAFALLSAGLKGRSSTRAGSGVSVLTLVEGLAGVVLMVTTLPGVFALRVTVAVGMGTVVLVLLSSAAHLVKVRASSRAREESEGQRLYVTIKYELDDGPPEEGVIELEESPAAPEELPEGEGEPSGA